MSSKENATQPVDIESEVSKILLQIGVPAYIKGYGYLRDAILLMFKDPDLINSAGKVLYPRWQGNIRPPKAALKSPYAER